VCDVYQAPAWHYLGGEPIFVANPSETTTGVVICQLFDAEHTTSAFALFDALHVTRGPIGILRLREPIPLLFHASFHRT
jgi:carotenoid cleavage dioxygenase-like enzyme